MMAGLIAFIVSPASMAWSAVPLPVWLRWTGAVVGILAGLLLAWTFRSLGANLTDTVVTRTKHTLITTGPYRWIRHPLYTAVALATVANGLVAANWFVLVTGSLAFALLVIRCRTEEANLMARFGDEYLAYAAGTGRFLPRLRSAIERFRRPAAGADLTETDAGQRWACRLRSCRAWSISMLAIVMRRVARSRAAGAARSG